MRPGRSGDLQALVELWHAEVREGRRDAVPRRAHVEVLADRFDWAARSRVIEDGRGGLAGVVMVSAYTSPDGSLAQLDLAAIDDAAAEQLARWGVGLSRASGAIAVMAWTGCDHGGPLARAGLKLARPWWRMDRSLAGQLPDVRPVPGYDLLDAGARTSVGWAELHNTSFADHWRFSYRTEEELMTGKDPGLCLMAVRARDRSAGAITLCDVEDLERDARPQPVGIVRSVGTTPDHRRRGLATWLVAESLARLRARGARHASLYVDAMNPTRAYDAYRKLGFEVAFEAEVWEATFE